ncbi:hypothetical protein HS048_34115 [Planomonospora sp. ID91781]|uniref:competence protein CoiA family protein n=1 Tax=Planomonospora sp. ID91781 TaxID=2738135 RepID=UPI0018C38B63|nr:competence protein CoiA family protein [Planomonospora sp. ID91781]MBG0825723.1 hypothetical protein [Planomonospora sp. ID91781]
MRDTRKVQTAVLGSPDSHDPILMPFERIEAERLRGRFGARGFYCGEWLGGCGKELYTRIGPVKVPHFAHHPEDTGRPVNCRRSSNDAQSADHLYIRQALTEWLKQQGHQVKEIVLEGTVPQQGGICTGMTIETTKGLMIAIALRNDLRKDSDRVWPQRDAVLRRSHKRVEWLFAPPVPMVKHMTKREGHAFVVGCESDGLRRTVRIGSKSGGKIPLWANLEDCKIDEQGRLWTPQLAEVRRPQTHERVQPSAQPAQDRPAVAEPREMPQELVHDEVPAGFPLSVNLLTVVPRAVDGRIVEAEVESEIVKLPAENIRVRLAEPPVDLSVGHPHHVVGPALITMESSPGQTAMTWTIHAQALQPFLLDEPEATGESPAAVADTSGAEPSVWLRMEAILRDLSQARDSGDTEASARLYTEAESLMPHLTERQLKQARRRISGRRETVRAATPVSAKKTPKGKPRVFAPAASKQPRKQANAAEVHRNQVMIVFRMIDRAVSQGSVREARKLCQALERFMAGLPAEGYQAEHDRFAGYKQRLLGGGRPSKRKEKL